VAHSFDCSYADEPFRGLCKTLDDVGLRLGLSRERIRQIERDSLMRLATLREMQAVAE